VASFQSELTLDRGLKPFAQFGGAVHGQRGLFAVQKNLEMRTLARLKGGPLLFQPLFHLLGVHASDTKKSALQNPYNPHECWRYGVNADDGISQESLSEGIFSGGFA
jgi:hypothetical protein